MKPVSILLLISEMEGCCSYTKQYGFTEDHKVLREMCNKYYKLYFRLKKQGSVAEQVDAPDLKSVEHYARESSSLSVPIA